MDHTPLSTVYMEGSMWEIYSGWHAALVFQSSAVTLLSWPKAMMFNTKKETRVLIKCNYPLMSLLVLNKTLLSLESSALKLAASICTVRTHKRSLHPATIGCIDDWEALITVCTLHLHALLQLHWASAQFIGLRMNSLHAVAEPWNKLISALNMYSLTLITLCAVTNQHLLH